MKMLQKVHTYIITQIFRWTHIVSYLSPFLKGDIKFLKNWSGEGGGQFYKKAVGKPKGSRKKYKSCWENGILSFRFLIISHHGN